MKKKGGFEPELTCTSQRQRGAWLLGNRLAEKGQGVVVGPGFHQQGANLNMQLWIGRQITGDGNQFHQLRR